MLQFDLLIALKSAEVQCGMLLQTINTPSKPSVYLDDGSEVPHFPSTGQHVISLNIGDVVDVIIINEPANFLNGDLT